MTTIAPYPLQWPENVARTKPAARVRSFAALLPAPGAVLPWHVVLGVVPAATRAEIEAAYRALIRKHHPDAGGTAEQAAEVNRARDEGLRAGG